MDNPSFPWEKCTKIGWSNCQGKAYPADIIAAEPTEWLEWDYDDSHLDVIDRHHGSILPGLVIC